MTAVPLPLMSGFDRQKVSRSHVSDFLWEPKENPEVQVSDRGSVRRSEKRKTAEDELVDHRVTRGHATTNTNDPTTQNKFGYICTL